MFNKILSIAVLAMFSSSVSAMLITDQNNPYVFLNEGQSHTITHDLSDDGVPTDFSVVGAVLKLGFSDGTVFQDWQKDLAGISGDGISGIFEVDGTHLFGYDIRTIGVGPSGIASLNIDGLLQVTVTALATTGRFDGHNDFWWKTSLLKAEVEATQVPEPGVLGLLMLGLVGLTLARKAKRS